MAEQYLTSYIKQKLPAESGVPTQFSANNTYSYPQLQHARQNSTNEYQRYGFSQQPPNQAFFGNSFNPSYSSQYFQNPSYGMFQYHQPQQMTPPPSPAQCQKCGFVAETYAQLIEHDSLNHYRQVNLTSEEPIPKDSTLYSKNGTFKKFKCYLCNKSLSSEAYLKRHVKLVHTIKSSSTSVLYGKAVSQALDDEPTMDSYTTYYPERAQAPVVYNFQADTQSLVPVESPNLTTVPNTQTAESKCNICNKVFSGPCYLVQHNRAIHTGVKPHRCKSCGKKFAEKEALALHIKKHTDDKPNKCYLCPRSYNYKSDLIRHLAGAHTTGGNLHVCSICEKAFTRKDQLKRHIVTHQKFDEDYATRIY